MVEQLRSLIAEGTPGKALNLLLSKGLHSVSDPTVRAALDELHPQGALSTIHNSPAQS